MTGTNRKGFQLLIAHVAVGDTSIRRTAELLQNDPENVFFQPGSFKAS
jgi:hypothetical protein